MFDPKRISGRSVLMIIVATMAVVITWTVLPTLRPKPAGAGGELYEYFPIVGNDPTDKLEIHSVTSMDGTGNHRLAFEPGTPVIHRVAGVTLTSKVITVTLQLTETGPCGAGSLYSDTLSLDPGPWQLDFPATAPGCQGIYETAVVVLQDNLVDELESQYAVNEPFEPVLSTNQGFDRCVPPTVDQLQKWWDDSPYSVVNIYLGGIHYPLFCQNGIQDAVWVHKVAAQGWAFTAIWVGPQPPCTSFTHRFSLNTGVAYQEGREEASDAADRARELGLFGEITLHYDIEGYTSDATTACRTSVNSFLQGWTDRLHELGLRAGAYGGGCSSFITDWAGNNPTIDQVWIAHWQLPAVYNPDATVWNAACVSNSLWANQQRLKQYAGDHTETWGGTSMTIDSNVFDTVAIGWEQPASETAASPALIQGFGPLGQTAGWVLTGGRLYRTEDLGATWTDISPDGLAVLDSAFTDPQNGWVAGFQAGDPTLQVGRTVDGGRTWSLTPVGVPQGPFGDAYLEILDGSTLWLAVKLQSGSAFSLGELYASADGGTTWEARTHPLGAPVVFSDALTGWTFGGPAGVSAFETLDGGRTWTPVDPDAVPGNLRAPEAEVAGALPDGTVATAILDAEIAWAMVQEGGCVGPKEAQSCQLVEQIRVTADGGLTWTPITAITGTPKD